MTTQLNALVQKLETAGYAPRVWDNYGKLRVYVNATWLKATKRTAYINFNLELDADPRNEEATDDLLAGASLHCVSKKGWDNPHGLACDLYRDGVSIVKPEDYPYEFDPRAEEV